MASFMRVPYRRNASVKPPSTGMTWPVVLLLSSPASQQMAAAQSDGRMGCRVIVRCA
jgi:alkanesulfonate monooxygenase SsuD/methylene tetrahydromethanopterin reductase-like flavin-dependent oxidoreductase (luciferase family)